MDDGSFDLKIAPLGPDERKQARMNESSRK